MLIDVKLQRFSGAVFGALFIISVLLAAFIPAPGTAQTGESIKIRLQHGADRRACVQRQVRAGSLTSLLFRYQSVTPCDSCLK
jgi:hypothetical protein